MLFHNQSKHFSLAYSGISNLAQAYHISATSQQPTAINHLCSVQLLNLTEFSQKLQLRKGKKRSERIAREKKKEEQASNNVFRAFTCWESSELKHLGHLDELGRFSLPLSESDSRFYFYRCEEGSPADSL